MFTRLKQIRALRKTEKAEDNAKFNSAYWERYKKTIEIENQIADEKEELTKRKKERGRVSWSKKFLIFLFGIFF